MQGGGRWLRLPPVFRRRTMTLRDFLRMNFGWDLYDWQPGEIEF